jgi:hypothetical protein
VGKLLATFFTMDDSNFARRYKFFYDELAPSLDLYRVRVGDTLTINGLHQERLRTVHQPQGVRHLHLRGLEQSPQAGELNLMDMVSFRELTVFSPRTARRRSPPLKAGGGAKDVTRENAEAQLFGAKEEAPATGRTISANATPGVDPDAALAGLAGRLRREELADGCTTPSS